MHRFPSFVDRDRVRRVTTGHDAFGRATVISTEVLTRQQGALVLWSADGAPTARSPALPVAHDWWPPPGGYRVLLSTRQPDRQAAADAPRAWPDINDTAGFHASNSADVVIVLSGRIWLELDDGREVELGAGDSLVQNGTRHRWHNRADEWPLMMVVVVGAESRADG